MFPAQKTKPKRGRRRLDSSDEENGGDSPTPAPRTQRGRGAKKKPAVVFNDSDDSDIELFEVDKSSRKKKGIKWVSFWLFLFIMVNMRALRFWWKRNSFKLLNYNLKISNMLCFTYLPNFSKTIKGIFFETCNTYKPILYPSVE